MLKRRVLVIGDVMTDILARLSGPIAVGSDRRAEIATRPGGSAATQAVWLARFGLDVDFVGRVGAADHARESERLREAGVTPHLAADPERESGRLIALIDPSGERSFLTDRGANDGLAAEDIPDALIASADHVHISGYSFVAPGPRAAAMSVIARAGGRSNASAEVEPPLPLRERGRGEGSGQGRAIDRVEHPSSPLRGPSPARGEGSNPVGTLAKPISIDPGSAEFLREVGPSDFLDWIAGASILFPNAEEAETLAASGDPEVQRARLTARFPLVVVKRGAAGADAWTHEAAIHVPAPLARVIDATGAGDAFCAAFLAARLDGQDLRTCLQRAVAAGSAATEFLGGRP